MSNYPPGAEHDVRAPYNEKPVEKPKTSAYSHSYVVDLLNYVGENGLTDDPDLDGESMIERYEEHLEQMKWNEKISNYPQF